MKYIQSFYQYPVTFSSIGKTLPARSAQGPLKNLMEIEDKELKRLEDCEPFFRELVNAKKIRVLNKMPESYVSSAQRINEANEEIERLKAENEALKARDKVLNGGTAVVKGEEKQPFTDDEVIDAGLTQKEREKEYQDMTYDELKDACKYAGIETKNKKKADLIKDLLALTEEK